MTRNQKLGLTATILFLTGNLIFLYLISQQDHPFTGVRRNPDKLPGGLADEMSELDFDSASLAVGMRHEMEHTHDPEVAKEIAMDHLSEDPAYYEKLSRAGL